MLIHDNSLSFATVALCLSLMGCEVLAAGGTLHEGKTYHVSPSGNDTTAGGKDSPWRSIQYAADSVSPGDRVQIHDGT